MWRQVLDDVIRKTVSGFAERLAAFGPNLLAMVLILLVGVLAAGTVRLLPRPTLPWLRVAPGALATATAWTVLALFVLLAVGALNLQFAMDLLTRTFSYLPQILIAGALLVLGILVSGFFERSVLIAAVNAGLPPARLLAGVVRTALLVLFVALALARPRAGRPRRAL